MTVSTGVFRIFGLALLTAVVLPGHAATRYVAKWGTGVDPCTKSDPCGDIQSAINASGPNDRIIVGPGTYTGNLLINPARSGLKLESEAGRHATTIVSDGGDHILVIESVRVRVGKKGKGFTFVGATNPNRAGIYVNAPEDFARISIEGNRFGRPRNSGSTDFDNYHGFRVVNGGGKIQIRNNIMENNEFNGIDCFDCIQALIKDNRVESNGTAGIYLFGNSEGAVSMGNVVSANGGYGLGLSPDSEGTTLRDNVSELNSAYGISVLDGDGARVEANIVAGNTDYGIYIQQLEFIRGGVRVGKNLVSDHAGSPGDGILLSLTEDSRVDNNTSVSNGQDGIVFDGGSTRSLKNNAAYANGACGLRGNVGSFDNYKFFSAENGINSPCGLATFNPMGPAATRPANLKIRKAAKAVGG